MHQYIKRALFLFFVCILFITGKCDTLDFWHISMNNKIIAQVNGIMPLPEIYIDTNSISLETDFLIVQYGMGCGLFNASDSQYEILNSQNQPIYSVPVTHLWDRTPIPIKSVYQKWKQEKKHVLLLRLNFSASNQNYTYSPLLAKIQFQ